MKKSRIAFCLVLALLLGLSACTSAGPGQVLDGDGMVWYGVQGNLLKLEADAFCDGTLEGLEIVQDGEMKALALADGVSEGTFTSHEYEAVDFTQMVASWNAQIPRGTSVEIWARAQLDGPDGEWTDWLTWGKFTPYERRGSVKDKKCDAAYMDVDTFILKDQKTAWKVQVKAVLRRSEEIQTGNSIQVVDPAATPLLRRVTMTFAGGDMRAAYAEEPVETLPDKVLCPAPAISQGIRYGSIADSICSPTTMTVMLLSRETDPDLARYSVLLPEMYAMLTKDDAEDMFGNWSFTVSGAGLYGYEAYCQFGSEEILMQELAQGRTCGINVTYSDRKNDSCPYLEGCAGSTNGHLIAIIGYEYEDGVRDEDHLYFYSSDSYSDSDDTSYRRYKWTELSKCWPKRMVYIIPSLEREVTPAHSPMLHFGGQLDALGNNEYQLLGGLGADGKFEPVDPYDFERDAGFICWCVDGVCTDNTGGGTETDSSIVYEKPMQVYANNTFSYTKMMAGGKIKLDLAGISQRAAEKLGVDPDDVWISVYAISPYGYCYSAGAKGTEPIPTYVPGGN